MNKALRCIPSSAVAASAHGGGIVLMDLASGQMFASNLVGARIWQALEQHESSETIAADVCRHHRVSFETAHAATVRFIAELAARRLVESRDE